MTSLYRSNIGFADPILLGPMRYLSEAIEPDDDWTGLTARSERKKRQNRLNQRAYRRRREAGTASNKTTPSPPASSASEKQVCCLSSKQNPSKKPSSPFNLFTAVAEKPYPFPLSTDHLMLLVQYNLYRGCLTNMVSLNITDPRAFIISVPQPNAPPSFAPTFLQSSIMHPAWIDSIPSAALRDNFIRAHGTYDGDEFWYDAVGTLHAAYNAPTSEIDARRIKKEYKFSDDKFSGLMCWGEPWQISSYEISPSHYKKWGRFLFGCEDLMRGTNRWRVLRGETPIRFKELEDEVVVRENPVKLEELEDGAVVGE